MPQKIIRDPVHDVIAFDVGAPIDGLLFKLLNAAEFQRLRRILQLGMAHLAYPGATHSRYSHSLGVMETARKILSHLDRSLLGSRRAISRLTSRLHFNAPLLRRPIRCPAFYPLGHCEQRKRPSEISALRLWS